MSKTAAATFIIWVSFIVSQVLEEHWLEGLLATFGCSLRPPIQVLF